MESRFRAFDSTDSKHFNRYRAAGIPRQFWRMTWADYTLNPNMIKLSQNYIKKFPAMLEGNVGMLLSGSTGTGKTMIVSLIAKYVSACLVKSVKFVQIDDIIQLQNKSWVEKEEAIKFNSILRLPTLLIVDDIPSSANKSKDIVPVVHTIVRHRLEVGKPLIMTTKLSERELVSALNETVVKEILELCPKINISSEDNFRDTISRRKQDILKDF